MPSAPSILAAARALALDIEALLLPRACVACGRLVRGESRVVCDRCRLELRAIAPPRCRRCGGTLDPWETARRADGQTGSPTTDDSRPPGRPSSWPSACGFCRRWPAALAWAASAVCFDEGAARRLVHALKYEGWRCAARPMAEAMARACGGRLAGAAALVPVPLGRTRARQRGHNQAEVLADALAARTGVPVARDALARIRETHSQTALAPQDRLANVAGAFAARRPAAFGGAATTGPVVLVDDVLTTGATLGAAAQALASAGVALVGAVTFARAEKPA